MKSYKKRISSCTKFAITKKQQEILSTVGGDAVNPFEWPYAKFNFKKK